MKHTPTPWKLSDTKSDCIISDSNEFLTVQGTFDKDSYKYYGGYLIGESITLSNAKRIVECVNACEGQDIETVKLATAHRNDCLELEKANEMLIKINERLIDALEGMRDTFSKLPASHMSNREIDALNDANEILTQLKK